MLRPFQAVVSAGASAGIAVSADIAASADIEVEAILSKSGGPPSYD